MFIRNSIAKIRLFAAAGLCILFWNCSEENLDTPLGGNPDAAGLSGLIHMASPEDYTSENHIIMLQDDEPESIFLDPAQRSFDPRRPVQVSVTENRELQLRAYSPRRIRDLKVWASVEGYPDEFLLAQFDIVPPFLEFRTSVPFVSADKEYTTAAGKTILILKTRIWDRRILPCASNAKIPITRSSRPSRLHGASASPISNTRITLTGSP